MYKRKEIMENGMEFSKEKIMEEMMISYNELLDDLLDAYDDIDELELLRGVVIKLHDAHLDRTALKVLWLILSAHREKIPWLLNCLLCMANEDYDFKMVELFLKDFDDILADIEVEIDE